MIQKRIFILIAVFSFGSAISAHAQKKSDVKKTKISGYAPVNGLKMYYEIYGKGDIPLVLIHGGGSTIESSFGNLIPLISGYGKLIAVELQAHGRTTDRDAPESFAQDADDVIGLLKYLKIDKANFLGFSNGGTTTLTIAIRHPAIVNKIVVVSSNYKREGMVPGFFEGLQNATLKDMPAALQAAYLKVAPVNNLQTMFEKDRQRMADFKDINDDDIKSIKAPALLMVADRDVVTSEHVVKMSHLISNSRLVILPGTHGSFIGEIEAQQKSRLPEVTAIIVREFLNGL
ncbi:MAG: alpha/beta hydrolase [Bacteroidetes bacterium]|nr:alpha/beta hydrolase [Bacteroidota bacterium]